MVRSITRCIAVLAAILLVGLLLAAYQAAQFQPEFYKQALQLELRQSVEAGDELERRVFSLHNDLRRRGAWDAEFTDQQINGWLAVDLPTKFPRTLPDTVSAPRVAISSQRAQVAYRLQYGSLSTVISLDVRVRLTDRPNEIAVEIHRLRAGALPLPTVQVWKDKIEQLALRADLAIRWVKRNGKDVALVKIPLEHQELRGSHLCVDSIRLDDGEIRLAGRNSDTAISDARAAETDSAPLR